MHITDSVDNPIATWQLSRLECVYNLTFVSKCTVYWVLHSCSNPFPWLSTYQWLQFELWQAPEVVAMAKKLESQCHMVYEQMLLPLQGKGSIYRMPNFIVLEKTMVWLYKGRDGFHIIPRHFDGHHIQAKYSTCEWAIDHCAQRIYNYSVLINVQQYWTTAMRAFLFNLLDHILSQEPTAFLSSLQCVWFMVLPSLVIVHSVPWSYVSSLCINVSQYMSASQWFLSVWFYGFSRSRCVFGCSFWAEHIVYGCAD